jgi:hypothetical protein
LNVLKPEEIRELMKNKVITVGTEKKYLEEFFTDEAGLPALSTFLILDL